MDSYVKDHYNESSCQGVDNTDVGDQESVIRRQHHVFLCNKKFLFVVEVDHCVSVWFAALVLCLKLTDPWPGASQNLMRRVGMK